MRGPPDRDDDRLHLDAPRRDDYGSYRKTRRPDDRRLLVLLRRPADSRVALPGRPRRRTHREGGTAPTAGIKFPNGNTGAGLYSPTASFSCRDRFFFTFFTIFTILTIRK